MVIHVQWWAQVYSLATQPAVYTLSLAPVSKLAKLLCMWQMITEKKIYITKTVEQN